MYSTLEVHVINHYDDTHYDDTAVIGHRSMRPG